MPSEQHQALLLWGLRSMVKDGYRVEGIDGHVEGWLSTKWLPQPPDLGGVRPDACGIHEQDDVFGFVEAKTEWDIDNAHTRKQLSHLAGLRMGSSGKPCPLYVAIPRGSAYALDRVLIDIGLLRASHIRRLHIPSVFLESGR